MIAVPWECAVMVEMELPSEWLWKAHEGLVVMCQMGCVPSSGMKMVICARAVMMPAIWVLSPFQLHSFSMWVILSMLVSILLGWLGTVW